WATHVDADRSAGPHIQLPNRTRTSVRTPPLCHVLWIGPHLEHKLSWSIVDSREHQLRLFFLCRRVSCSHTSSPYSVRLANSHPDDPSSLARTSGSAQPNRQHP